MSTKAAKSSPCDEKVMKNLPELHCEDKNSHLSTLNLMEYLNHYQARRTIWHWYQRTKTHIQKKKKSKHPQTVNI